MVHTTEHHARPIAPAADPTMLEKLAKGFESDHVALMNLIERARMIRDRVDGGGSISGEQTGLRPVPTGMLATMMNTHDDIQGALATLDTVIGQLERLL